VVEEIFETLRNKRIWKVRSSKVRISGSLVLRPLEEFSFLVTSAIRVVKSFIDRLTIIALQDCVMNEGYHNRPLVLLLYISVLDAEQHDFLM
jgi:hypothetical protein